MIFINYTLKIKKVKIFMQIYFYFIIDFLYFDYKINRKIK